MSYQVLARQYRPHSFHTLVGQDHVVRALTHALKTQRLHHAYLFAGTRGVGKTTLSRILAKSLNCLGKDGLGGITEQPCGVCAMCRDIDAGRCVDYIEMDAASHRGVEDMTQVLEQAVYAPSGARFKVYMIDEVHMLSNHAFNAMLKTLEEPPPHIKFILATTDPQKIPVTVLSRCLQFNLKHLSPAQVVSHLEHVLRQEQIPFEAPALHLLAKNAQGSMRDALSLTDQAIASAAGQVTLDAVQDMLGALDQTYLIRLLEGLSQQDGVTMLSVAQEMAARGLSYELALQDLASLCHAIALAQTVPEALSQDRPWREDILRLAGLFDAEDIQLYYQIAVLGRRELDWAPDQYAGFSMTLLRMLAFRPSLPPPPTDHPKIPLTPASIAPIAPAPIAPVAPTSVVPILVTPTVAAEPQKPLAWDGHWPTLAATLPVRGVARELAQQSELIKATPRGELLHFHLRIPIPTLGTPSAIDKLSTALSQQLNCPVSVDIVVGTVNHTAHVQIKNEQATQAQLADDRRQNDPFIQSVAQEFGATVN